MRKSFTKLLPLALVFLLALSVSACNMGRDAARNNDATRQGGNMHQAGMEQQRTVDRARNFDQMRENDRFGADRTDMRGRTSAGVHGNTRMEVSQEIADAIAQMEEVSTANVLLTDRNAYVAVMMDDGPHQTNLRGTNRYGNDRADNGLVGTDLHFGGYGAENDVSDRIKEQIADKVRELAPHIQNVFVSANPDFIERVNGFMEQLTAGHPIRGLVGEFNTMVERMFPESN